MDRAKNQIVPKPFLNCAWNAFTLLAAHALSLSPHDARRATDADPVSGPGIDDTVTSRPVDLYHARPRSLDGGQMPDQTKRAPRVCSPVVTLPRWSLLLRARIQVHTRIIHALHQEWTALGSRCRHNRDVSSNSFAGDILVIPGSIALCRGPRRFVAGATRFTSFASGARGWYGPL